MHRIAALALASTCLLGSAALSSANAQSVEDFYAGKTISIYTHTPTGAYDLSARLVGRGLTKYLPGAPNVVIRQMVGANGVIAANHVYNVATKDGTHICAMARLAPYIPLFGTGRNVQYDVTKVHWLGSSASENAVALSWHDSDVKTAADLFQKELLIGATAPGADTHLYPLAMNRLIGTKFKIITGYQSPADIVLAIEKGEVKGSGSWSASNLVAAFPHFVSEKKVNLLLQLGLAKDPDLPDVPLASEFAKTDEERTILEILMAVRAYSYPFFVAPETPPDRVAALKKAFSQTIRDDEFLKIAKQQGRPGGMADGDAVAKAYKHAYSLPESTVARIREVVRTN